MTPMRWLLTIVSFAATIGVSLHLVLDWSQQGMSLTLPAIAHLLAATAVCIEVLARALKIRWSARAAGISLSLGTATRTCLGGDFAAAITPARSGAEPARFFVLSESGLKASSVLVILYAELFLEVFSLAAVVLVVAVVFRHAGVVVATLVSMVGGYATVILGIGGAALYLSRRNMSGPPPRWARRLRLTGGRWLTIQTALIKLRATIDSVEHVHTRPAVYAFLASVVHVAIRLTVLPALVLTSVSTAPLAPLALWPLGFLYGAAVVPAPGGGGAVEMAFRAALGNTIPVQLFAAALIWWRFYTFYIYILLGALAAGRTVMRAVRKTEEYEAEVEGVA
ncbi:MAG TPA: lysylphosphatidylglycerol synthase transmembrane domain-containing protein [Gemmatimonadaceae bacterium]|nr:lysylphosphatidylglycerol synthase transmembrane domain-containing protein [Gemmatimonadaceae bacterium]